MWLPFCISSWISLLLPPLSSPFSPPSIPSLPLPPSLSQAQNIKNFKSQRWQTLLNFNSQRRLLLTGTPLQNNLMELWSLMHFLMPTVFSSHSDFKEWFSNPLSGMVEGSQEYNESIVTRLHQVKVGGREGGAIIRRSSDVTYSVLLFQWPTLYSGTRSTYPWTPLALTSSGCYTSDPTTSVSQVLRPFLLRRLKMEVERQMPKKYEHILLCRLSKRQRFLYEEYMSRSK